MDFDVPYFVDEATKVRGQVLELACGTGRVSLPLIQAGVDLTCVDISAEMLAVLHRKMKDAGLAAQTICANICELTPVEQYDLILFPFHSFAEIVGRSRQQKVIDFVCASLNPRGTFICTLLNPPVHRQAVDGKPHVVGRYSVGDKTLAVSGISRGGDPVVQREQYFELYSDSGNLISKQSMDMTYELVDSQDFLHMVESQGFETVSQYGDYLRSPFDPEESAVIVWKLIKA